MLPKCPSPARYTTLVLYKPLASHNTAGRTAIEASRGRNLAGELPREVPVALDDEANEPGHGNTPVLDLGVAQEADRRLVACSARHSCFVQTQQNSKDAVEKVGHIKGGSHMAYPACSMHPTYAPYTLSSAVRLRKESRLALIPEVRLGEVEGIPELHRRVELLRVGLQIILGGHVRRGRTRGRLKQFMACGACLSAFDPSARRPLWVLTTPQIPSVLLW